MHSIGFFFSKDASMYVPVEVQDKLVSEFNEVQDMSIYSATTKAVPGGSEQGVRPGVDRSVVRSLTESYRRYFTSDCSFR